MRSVPIRYDETSIHGDTEKPANERACGPTGARPTCHVDGAATHENCNGRT
jgi:hypothetical protein